MKARTGYICADMVLIWPFQLHIPRQQESSSASLSKKGYKCFLSSSPCTDTPLKSLRPFNEVRQDMQRRHQRASVITSCSGHWLPFL
ncbi:hypothetical protein CUMW_123830 [Citrus unshiu]|nr:hypothetical protein CUMW_123830 [Citrus unshiu]